MLDSGGPSLNGRSNPMFSFTWFISFWQLNLHPLACSLSPFLTAPPPNVKLSFRINATSYIQHSVHLFFPVLLFHSLPLFRKLLQTSDTQCPLKTKLNLGIQEDAGKTEYELILFAQLKMCQNWLNGEWLLLQSYTPATSVLGDITSPHYVRLRLTQARHAQI